MALCDPCESAIIPSRGCDPQVKKHCFNPSQMVLSLMTGIHIYEHMEAIHIQATTNGNRLYFFFFGGGGL